jgi:hypothetical protein
MWELARVMIIRPCVPNSSCWSFANITALVLVPKHHGEPQLQVYSPTEGEFCTEKYR